MVIDRVLLIVSDRALVAVAPLASVTWAVKLEVPVAVGVPLITPVEEFKDRPAGRLPTVTAHVNGEVPPLTERVCENGV